LSSQGRNTWYAHARRELLATGRLLQLAVCVPVGACEVDRCQGLYLLWTNQYAKRVRYKWGLLAPVAPSESMLKVGDPADEPTSNTIQSVSLMREADGMSSVDSTA
jgi:hypothetical protein